MMDDDELTQVLTFLERAADLKSTLRSGFNNDGTRETTAAHTWRLALMAMMIGPEQSDVDLLHLIKLCLVHDLGEAICGDVPATEQSDDDNRSQRERAAVLELAALLPAGKGAEIAALHAEYEAGQTQAARMAKGLDKLETILQHSHGRNGPDFDYGFNLHYGRKWTNGPDLLAQVRERIDARTRARMD